MNSPKRSFGYGKARPIIEETELLQARFMWKKSLLIYRRFHDRGNDNTEFNVSKRTWLGCDTFDEYSSNKEHYQKLNNAVIKLMNELDPKRKIIRKTDKEIIDGKQLMITKICRTDWGEKIGESRK